MKTSKDIVIQLIDEGKICGEEAYVLINDILQSEMLETYKALENKKNSDVFTWQNQGTITTKPYHNNWTVGTIPTTDSNLTAIPTDLLTTTAKVSIV